MAGWIKMPLGNRPPPRRLCVSWGPSSPPQKGGGADPALFGPCLLWPKGWMDQDGIWHGGGPWSRLHCARWGPISPPQKKAAEPPNFWPISIVAKRLDASTATLYEGRPQLRRLCVRWGPSSPSPKRGWSPPIFGQCLLWPNGCMYQDK